jgi:ABC-type branched-subunit amino acid transport system substrate-binding protein
MVRFAAAKEWKRVGIFYGRHEHGTAVSALLLTKAAAAGLTVPFVFSYLPASDWQEQDFRPVIAEMLKKSFDAILLADELPWAAKVLIDMASMRVARPVLATDKLDSAQVWELAHDAGNNLYVASGVDPSSTSEAYVAFKERFRKRFGADPGYGASQGYEAFTLLVNACLLSKSAEPIIVSTTIRTGRWRGLFGEFAFLPNGEIVGRDVSIKAMVAVDGKGELKTEWTAEHGIQ